MITDGHMTFWKRLCEILGLPPEDDKVYLRVAQQTGISPTTVLGWQRGAYPKLPEHFATIKRVYHLGAREIEYLHIGDYSDLVADSLVEDINGEVSPPFHEWWNKIKGIPVATGYASLYALNQAYDALPQ